MDLYKILSEIAVKRPNHRETLEQTAAYIKEMLELWNVPFATEEFVLRPCNFFLLGATVLIFAVLLFLLVWRNKPVLALMVSLHIQ